MSLSDMAKTNLYLTAPHSAHADPAYFPWCRECQPEGDGPFFTGLVDDDE